MQLTSKIHYKLTIIFLLFALSGCMNNDKKAVTTQPNSIYKKWKFKKMDTSFSHKKITWVGNNILDMHNKDTLQFSYGGMHNKPTAYPYRIQHDTIFIQNKPGYKIVKLTNSSLYLMPIFTHQKVMSRDSEVMIYNLK